MRHDESFEVQQILRALGDRLHDHEVLDPRKTNHQIADGTRLRGRDDRTLERQAAEDDVDVDLRKRVSQQQNPGTAGEFESVRYAGDDPGSARRFDQVRPARLIQIDERVDVTGESRPSKQ